MVDEYEGREVAVIDILGAHLHAEMDDVVLVRFHGKMVELLEENRPENVQTLRWNRRDW